MTKSDLSKNHERENLFFQVIAKRYKRGSLIVICNLSIGQRNQTFADAAIFSAAMFDSPLHRTCRSDQGRKLPDTSNAAARLMANRAPLMKKNGAG